MDRVALSLIVLLAVLGTPGGVSADALKLPAYGELCLDAKGGDLFDNSPSLIVYGCHGGENQQWLLTRDGEVRGFGNRCLDARGDQGPIGAMTTIILYGCHGGKNQKWEIDKSSGVMRMKDSQLCLDARGDRGPIRSETEIILYSCHGGPNQRWQVVNAPVAFAKYPRFHQENDFGGHHAVTDVLIKDDGALLARTQTTNHVALKGNCVTATVFIFDKAGAELQRLGGQRYCVDGRSIAGGSPSSRSDRWDGTLTNETMKKMKSIGISQLNTTKPEAFSDALNKKEAQAVIQVIKAIISSTSADGGDQRAAQ